MTTTTFPSQPESAPECHQQQQQQQHQQQHQLQEVDELFPDQPHHPHQHLHQHPHQHPHHPHQPKAMMSPLPGWARFYFYGLHGLLDEILFTALFDLVFHPEGNRQLKGHTTITSFFIYGSLRYFMEFSFIYFINNGYGLKSRVAVWTLTVYVYEFAWGLFLRQFDACSWDYSHHPLNLLGLVTLLYAPVWGSLCLFQDFMYQYVFKIHVVHSSDDDRVDKVD